MSGDTDERNITQSELNAQIAMTKVNSRLDQLETLQEKQFDKIDTLVTEMKKVVHEVTGAHRDHIDSAFVSKDIYYQREEKQKGIVEEHLNAVSKRFTTSLANLHTAQEEREGRQDRQIVKLKVRMTQVTTALLVGWGAIQFAAKLLT